MATMFLVATSAMAQVFTTSPAILQESSSNVVITFHADKQSVTELQGLSASTGLYAHIGVFTTKSPGTWAYVKTDWNVNTPANKFTYVSENTWALNIGDIRSYFGITDATETVTSICIIARLENAGNGVGQTADNFIPVVSDGFQVAISHDAESTILTKSTTVNFNINTTENASIDLKVNGSSIGSATGAMQLSKSYTFSSAGSYEVTATANNGSTSATETVNFIYINPSQAATYPGGIPKMGAVENADGTVTFCIAAPSKSNVMIIPSWDNYASLDKNVMKYQDYNGNRYFWTTVAGLDPNTAYPYYYIVDGIYKVGDPYAKLVLDPWNDKWLNEKETIYPNLISYPYDKGIDGIMLAVYKGNIDNYDWNITDFNAPAAKDLIIYELLFRDFTGTEGEAEGNGTVRKAIEKIPYLKNLGINAVELMPIMEFNGNNSWGYNTNFYFAPDKAYGTHEDYKEFIDKCHEEGIAVILDIVFNQSDGLHPWYQMYPISSNPFYNETAPHDYSVLNDWKQENSLVRQQWKDVLQYWLKEFKVDGFRFDLVKGLANSDQYGSGTEAYNQSRIDNMKQFHAWIKEINPNAYHINENLADSPEENEMATDGQMNWSNINYASCEFVKAASASGANNNAFLATNNYRTWGSTVSYAESHDEERMGYKAVTEGVTTIKSNTTLRMRRLGSLAAQMLLTPGAHMIWQFGELGNEQTTKNSSGNDTSPKIVNWEYLNDVDRNGLYQSYSELCWLRRSNPDLFTETTAQSMIMNCNSENWSTKGRLIKLTNSTQELICVINTMSSNGSRTISSIPFNSTNNDDYIIASKSYGTEPTFDAANGQVTLPNNGYVVIVNKNVSGVEDNIMDEYNKPVAFGGQGEIIITGEYNNVNIYSITGQAYNTLQVPSGIYIVNIDGNTTKVIVK